MAIGLVGRKIGMTQIFDDKGNAIPVTVLQAGPCVVVQKKTAEKDGYAAVQLGFGEEKHPSKPTAGHFSKAGISPCRYLREFRLEPTDLDKLEVGAQVTTEIFKAGQLVDVIGQSKGKGFAGSIKRHNFGRGPMAHGSKYHRGPGSMGATGGSRVFKGRKLPGRMGNERVTAKNLQVVRVDHERNLLLVKGSVPGIRGSLVMIKAS
ncbi:MAG: 50S ribosomal protein L3 [Limnochordia bacterium]|jgi:large subunit ribosomal protein L3|nr:50S ribosomal protein L3 [Limnochordia bacterium]MDD2629759.1 50S ribosomal protein L3 [Limnochordia bacterium]MDD4517090.1 50S ribosomal protein L3 [Limnochordia bacterium]